MAVERSEEAPQRLWENRKDFPYVPSPVAHGEHVYFVNDAGFAGCYHARTGKRVWYERLADSGFTELDVRLRPDPARFEPGAQLEAFLATVILGAQLDGMAGEDREPFVRAVAARLAEPVVDYVRLEISAVRG